MRHCSCAKMSPMKGRSVGVEDDENESHRTESARKSRPNAPSRAHSDSSHGTARILIPLKVSDRGSESLMELLPTPSDEYFEYYRFLTSEDQPDTPRKLLLAVEFVMVALSVITNTIFCYCLATTSTFHPNLRIITVNNTFCAFYQGIVECIAIISTFRNNLWLQQSTLTILLWMRTLGASQVTFSYLNILAERAFATYLVDKYEKSGIFVSVFVIVGWWIFVPAIMFYVNILITLITSIIAPVLLVLLMEKLNREKFRTKPTALSLSAKYQLAENIRTLRMYRASSYMYMAANTLLGVNMLFTVLYFYPDRMYGWRVNMNVYAVIHAYFVCFHPLMLIRRHPDLVSRFRHLVGLRVEESAAANAMGKDIVFAEDHERHFRMLRSTWDNKLVKA